MNTYITGYLSLYIYITSDKHRNKFENYWCPVKIDSNHISC